MSVNTEYQSNEQRGGVSAATPEDMSDVGDFLWEIVKVCILAFIIIIPIRVFLFQPFFVKGSSMDPNFQDGQYLIIGELGYKRTDLGVFGTNFFSVKPYKKLQRQEVAVFLPPVEAPNEQFFIKRVIGLPGDTVEIKNGHITIRDAVHPGGFVLDESAYLDASVPTIAATNGGSFSVTLGENQYFMMGDNRTRSRDSRFFGPVNEDKIIGRVLVRAWPLTSARLY